MEIDSISIKEKDIEILSKKEYDKLEQILQVVNRKYVRLGGEDKRRNIECFQRCIDDMVNRMKNVNQTFKDLYQEIKYTGSFYEGSRVKDPNEFDINLVLRKPFDIVPYEDSSTSAGYVKLNVNQQVVQTTQNRDQCRWIENSCISAQNVIRWLEGVISKVFQQANAAGSLITVNGMYSVKVLTKSGPAITLCMQHINANHRREQIDVDFVPVFEFQYPVWPKNTRTIPPSCSVSRKWCVTPKVEHCPSNWRLSFAFLEKEMIHNLPNLKNVYRFMKRLRDCSVNLKNIKSYHIKTLFLWKVNQHNTAEWRKSVGRLFMMMLFELENSLERGEIPFFWDKKMNMISNVRPELKRDMYGRILNIRKKICRLLEQNQMAQLQEYMFDLFTQMRVQVFDEMVDLNGLGELNLNEPVVERESAQIQSSSWSCVVS